MVKTAMTGATHREESDASSGLHSYKFQQQIQAAAFGQTYLFLPTAKDLWDAVQETYLDLGLNKELDELRGQILGKEPLPSIREIFSEVQREESRRKVMLGEQQSSQSETFALVIHGGETFQPND
ncbi:hypothetical protein CK203_060193 [Vitis vinifera]|uniref:Uncharacterized protein n=1 Tax=Vitis vinifera TaxID=29760 RepID=A0A438G8J1_VITVI|nr:hypothetical protein CK203_060193 [Vitis vinifera]